MAIPLWPEKLLFLRDLEGFWHVGYGHWRRQGQPDPKDPGFYLPDFFLNDPEPWWIPEHYEVLHSEEWRKHLTTWTQYETGTSSPVTEPWQWREPPLERFSEAFSELKDLLAQGKIAKLVPIVFAHAARRPTPKEVLKVLRDLVDLPTKLIPYGGWWGEEGLLGATPEILLHWWPNFLETMALAGTAPAAAASLLESAKDRHEHQLVRDDILERLSAFGPVKATPTREWPLGSLKHLRTDLALAEAADFMTVIERLHPTPALGGTPRGAAWEWLKAEDRREPRGRFGAPFAVLEPGRWGLAVVAIRGVQWHAGATSLGVGCGVVPDSQLEIEWQELRLKREWTLRNLGWSE